MDVTTSALCLLRISESLGAWKCRTIPSLYPEREIILPLENTVPVVWLVGNKMRLGAVTQESDGYCSDVDGVRLCVRRKSSRKHEVARYFRVTSEVFDILIQKFQFFC